MALAAWYAQPNPAAAQPNPAAAQGYGPGPYAQPAPYGPPPYGPPPPQYGPPQYGPPQYGPPPYGPPPHGPPQYGPPQQYGPPPGPQGPPPKDITEGGIGVGGLIGLRGDYTSVDTATRDESSLGAQLHGFGTAIFSYEFLTASLGAELGIGVGTAGIEGKGGGLVNVGGIYHLGEHHGPLARLGLRGQYEGNDAFTFSFFEIPTLDVGYQVHFKYLMVDTGLRAGPVLTGKYDADPGERDVGVAPEWGGFLTVFAGPAMLDGSFFRVEDDAPMHVGKGRLCLAYFVGVCADTEVLFGDVAYPTAAPGSTGAITLLDNATTWYLGISLGIGGVFEDTAAPRN